MLHAILLALTFAPAPRVAPRVLPVMTPAVAAADTERPDADVREVVVRHADDVRNCYQSQGLRRNPTLRGEAELEITILPTGRVDSASVSIADLKGPGAEEVAACISTAARNWRFERGPYAVDTFVFPLQLLPEERPRVARTAASD